MSRLNINKINRIIDVNLNRAKEGLRVCEEIARFVLENRALTENFKTIRHKITRVKFPETKKALLKSRFATQDIGLKIRIAPELKRKNYQDIFFANIQRAKESIRVLEEFLKLKDINSALRFKKIRYAVYELEKKAACRIAALRNPG